MNRLEIITYREPVTESFPSSELKERCLPGDIFWSVYIQATDTYASKIEAWAKDATSLFPKTDNDIGREGICATKTARIVHALEHLVVLYLMMSGEISEAELVHGAIAITVPVTNQRGEEAALFWVKQGLVDPNRVEEIFKDIILSLGA